MSSDGDELTLSEAARRAGVSRSTIRRLRERGQLPGARKDDTAGWLVTVGDLRRAGLTVLTAEQAHEQGEQAREQGAEQGGAGEQPGSRLSLLTELAPLLEQVSQLQAERGELLGEQRVLAFRLEQAEQRLAAAHEQAETDRAAKQQRLKEQSNTGTAGLLMAALQLVIVAGLMGQLTSGGWLARQPYAPWLWLVPVVLAVLFVGWAWALRRELTR